MRVDVELKTEDFLAFVRSVSSGAGDGRRGLFVATAILILVLAALFGLTGLQIHLPSVLVAVVVFGVLVLVSIQRLQRRSLPADDGTGTVLGPHAYEFGEAGIRVMTPHLDYHVRWTGVREVRETGTHVFVMIDRNAGIIVPKRDLPPDEQGEFSTLVSTLRGWLPGGEEGETER
jgi:hypothetical protein